jgi:S1-C subfamily serine protease
MPTFRLMLVTVLSTFGTLVLAAGCDVGRSSSSTASTPTVVEAPTAAPTAAALSPTAAPAAPAPSQPSPVAERPPSASQPQANPGAGQASAQAAAPVARAAPARQADNPYDTVIRVYRDWRPSVVTVISTSVSPDFRAKPESSGTGSGFMIDDQGHVLTNNHVVGDANRLEITLASGTTLPAQLVGRDERFDLAVIKASIPGDQLRVMTLGDSDQIQVGEQTIAIGNPYGLEGTVTTGVVSGRRPLVAEPEGDGVLIGAVQTDASINPGNSGGPLMNGRGEVIGVNTLGLLPNRAQAGLNFAIPINNAKRILPDLLASGSYAHPFVGIGSAEITSTMADQLQLPVKEGLLVQSVEPSSGASQAGLRGGSQPREVGARRVAVGGDIVVAIDAQKVRRPEDFVAYLELNKKAGDSVTLSIVRDGQTRDVRVTLGERPRPTARPQR